MIENNVYCVRTGCVGRVAASYACVTGLGVCVCQVSDPNTLILEYGTTHATLRQSRINVHNFLSVLTRVSITGLDQMDGSGSDLIFH